MPHSGPGLESPPTPGGGDRAGPPPPGCLGRGSGTAGREDLRNEGISSTERGLPPVKTRMFAQEERGVMP